MLPALLLSLAAAGPLPATPIVQDAAAAPAENPLIARIKKATGAEDGDRKFLIAVSMTAKEGRVDDLIAAYRDAASKSLAEAGCDTYTLTRDGESPNEFLLYETWRSTDALESHLAQPYTRKFVGLFGELLSDSSVTIMTFVPPTADGGDAADE